MPSTIEQVKREFGGRGLAVLAINIEEPRATVQRFVRERALKSDVLLDPSGSTTRAYGVTATPTAFVVDRDGRLVAKAIGARPWTGEHGRALFDALLPGK